MTKLLKLFCAGFIILYFYFPSFAENVVLNDSFTSIQIGQKIEYFEDKEGNFTFEDISRDDPEKKWKASVKTAPSFGFTKSVYWVKFTAENKSGADLEFFLQEHYPLIDSLTAYIPTEDEVKVVEVGDLKPFEQRPFIDRTFIIPLKIKSGAAVTYYLRYKTASSMNLFLSLWRPYPFMSSVLSETRFLVFYYGIITVMIIYNLFVYFFVRRIEYLYYVLFIFFFLIFIMTQNGTAFQFLWPGFPWFANFIIPVSLCCLVFFALQFAGKFMNLKKISPLWYKLNTGLSIVTAVEFALCLFLPYGPAMVSSAALTTTMLVYGILLGIRLSMLKQRTAYFFTLSWLVFLLGGLAYVLMTFGAVPTNTLTIWSIQIGSGMKVVLLSIALADRMNTMRKELKVLNENLEDKVRERTEELQAAMEELESLNLNLVKVNQELEKADQIHRMDLRMAAVVQETFLPGKAPDVDDYEIAFIFKPAAGVSGDFYDFYYEGSKLNGVGLFDVSGHGISSGLLTLIAKSIILRNFEQLQNKKLGEAMELINRELISEFGKSDKYLTGILLKFGNGSVEYVNSGHPGMICLRGDSNRVVRFLNKDGAAASGMFLGIDMMDSKFQSIEIELKSGDVLFIFTDCLLESKNLNGDPYEEERVIKSLKSSAGSAQERLGSVMKDFYTFVSNKDNLDDDLTAVMIRKK